MATILGKQEKKYEIEEEKKKKIRIKKNKEARKLKTTHRLADKSKGIEKEN